MKKWKTLSKQAKSRSIIFKHETVDRISQDTGAKGTFDVVHCLNWVNIIPITSNQEVILVQQYRHGTDEITLEIPGGAINPGEPSIDAARRELEEETGHKALKLIHLGDIHPNPAFMSNKCAIYFAQDVYEFAPMNLDSLEEIELKKVSFEDIPKFIAEGKITHSLVISAFYLLENYRSRQVD